MQDVRLDEKKAKIFWSKGSVRVALRFPLESVVNWVTDHRGIRFGVASAVKDEPQTEREEAFQNYMQDAYGFQHFYKLLQEDVFVPVCGFDKVVKHTQQRIAQQDKTIGTDGLPQGSGQAKDGGEKI